MKRSRSILSFDLELTARCNNNCRHCYINLPATNQRAIRRELTIHEIDEIASEAVSLGALWCLITGGEPLLREDFSEIYLNLKRKGLLVSLFTNATLISPEHIKLFKKYPPRDVEVTVYGVTRSAYEQITRKPGSFEAFTRGIGLLMDSGIPIRLKAMALRTNLHEMAEIAEFCNSRTYDYFRFDPFLSLRYDGNERRNREIIAQRLAPEEIIMLEKSDRKRFEVLKKRCEDIPEMSKLPLIPLNHPLEKGERDDRIFTCGVGIGSFTLGWNGFFRLCAPLHHPDCIYDLRKGNLTEAWQDFVPTVRDMRSSEGNFANSCTSCDMTNLCFCCPAHAYLETGILDQPVELFCRQAEARVRELSLDVPNLETA